MANQTNQTPGQGAQDMNKDTVFGGSPSGLGQDKPQTPGFKSPDIKVDNAGTAGSGSGSSVMGAAGSGASSMGAAGSGSATSGAAGFGMGSTSMANRSGSGAGTAPAKSLYDQAKETAGQAYEVAAEKATTKLEEQKTTLSTGLASVADSVRKVSENLNGPGAKDGISKYTAEYTDMAAQKIESVAKYFEQKDVREMYSDLEGFARKNPAVFIGGAFTLGLLAARFLKSGNSRQRALESGRSFEMSQADREKIIGSQAAIPSVS